ncbi:hypothetical protein [Limosilactobacillus frumenti]|nr:hypothetical protein [Limosilactobacillus frumenti]
MAVNGTGQDIPGRSAFTVITTKNMANTKTIGSLPPNPSQCSS